MNRKVLWALTGVCASLILVACGSSGTPDGGDGTQTDTPGFDVPRTDTPVTPDGPRPDVVVVDDKGGGLDTTPPDDMTPTGPNTANVGNPCNTGSKPTVCGEGGQCAISLPGPGCSADGGVCNGACVAPDCTPDNPQTMPSEDNCGAGFQCAQFQGGATACLRECEPAKGGSNCGDDTVACSPINGVCQGACTDDTQCGKGFYCNTTYGECLNTGSKAGGAVGAACADDAACLQNHICAPEPDFPGGSCLVAGCSVDTTTFPCGEGNVCVPLGTGICFQGCTTPGGQDTCRKGYTCFNIPQTQINICYPENLLQ